MIERLARLSRPTKAILALGVVLLVLALTGVLNADRNVNVSKEEAIVIAQTRIDFPAETTRVKFVRRGFQSIPFWAVSFSIPDPGGSGYQRLTTVLVNAVNGEVDRVTHER